MRHHTKSKLPAIVSSCQEYGKVPSIRHVWSCDSDPVCQDFICRNFPKCEAIISCMSYLSDDWAPTVCAGRGGPPQLRMGPVDLFTAGFTCCARSRLNTSRVGPTCVRDGTGTTGTSWDLVTRYVSKHKPRTIVLENVVFEFRKFTVRVFGVCRVLSRGVAGVKRILRLRRYSRQPDSFLSFRILECSLGIAIVIASFTSSIFVCLWSHFLLFLCRWTWRRRTAVAPRTPSTSRSG